MDHNLLNEFAPRLESKVVKGEDGTLKTVKPKVTADAFLRRETVEALFVAEQARLACQAAFTRGATHRQRKEFFRLLDGLAYRFAMIWALRHAGEQVPDDLAAEIHGHLDDGSQFFEFLWDWTSGYGIDPERVVQAARGHAGSEAA